MVYCYLYDKVYHLKAIKSKQFWLLCGIAFCIGFLIRFVSITFRTFGALIGIDGNAFKYLGFAITFSTLISTPIWGCLVDKYGTKIILKITCAGCTILGVILYFSVNNNLFYLLCISISMINISGFSASINPHIMEIFTIKYTLEIGGLIGFFSGLNSIICSILSFIVSFYYTTGLVPAYGKLHFKDYFKNTKFFHIVHNLDPLYE